MNYTFRCRGKLSTGEAKPPRRCAPAGSRLSRFSRWNPPFAPFIFSLTSNDFDIDPNKKKKIVSSFSSSFLLILQFRSVYEV